MMRKILFNMLPLLFAGMLLLAWGCDSAKNTSKKNELQQVPPGFEADKVAMNDLEIPGQSPDEIKEALRQLQNVRIEQYLIGPGDRMNFSVYGEPDLDVEGLVVLPDGSITLKLIGEVRVSGLSIGEARRLIERKYQEYIYSPNASLIPYELSGSRFTIMGKVVEPGNYPIDGKIRLTDAIALAGGLATGYFQDNTIELSNLEHAYISRKGKLLPVNFMKAIYHGDMLNNVPIMDGDYIYIPSVLKNEIYVLGEVYSPGYIGYRENMTLTQAIAYARNLIEENASYNLIVVRGGLTHPKVFKVDFYAILKGESPDFLLKPNDVIYVPKSDLEDWNIIVSKIQPTLEAFDTLLDIRQKALPLKGGLIPRHANEWLYYPGGQPNGP